MKTNMEHPEGVSVTKEEFAIMEHRIEATLYKTETAKKESEVKTTLTSGHL